MRRYTRKLRRIFQEDAGDAKLEFAMSAMTLLMAIFGAMDFARAGYVFHFVSYAAQQGTRYAMVRGASWGTSCASASSNGCTASSSNVQSYVQGLAGPLITSSSITVTTTWPGTNVGGSTAGCSTTNTAGCLVKVKVSYPFSFPMSLSFLPSITKTFTGTSEAVIQW
ncbi:MAG: pilus assembly protein [Silvibacterium sp.]|nr:pilus assembly protein [Silvibacterium sp.]